jgi:hypothetical protein
VADRALALLGRPVRVRPFEHVFVMAPEAEGLQVVSRLNLEQQRCNRSAMRIVAVGAVFRRVVDRFRRRDLGGDVFVTAHAQVRRIFDGELVQISLGLVALLTFSGFGEIRPVAALMISDFGVAFAARTRSGRVDCPGRLGRARPGLRRTGQQECGQGNDKARRTRPSPVHCSTPLE